MLAFIIGIVVATLVLTVLVQSGIINLKGNSFDSIKKTREKITSDVQSVENSMLKGFERGIKGSQRKENQSSNEKTNK
jgi:hypothetical protein